MACPFSFLTVTRFIERGIHMDNFLLISDAAKEVQVESHVLRYWEEELHLTIRRNELGHRYYTKEDVERFKQIKGMKERGLQLKAIKMILKDGKIDVMMPEEEKEAIKQQEEELEGREMGIDIISSETQLIPQSREEKARRLQWLLQQMMTETLQENNKELCREIKESIIKELDYQFRVQEEREEERERIRGEQEEMHFQKLDELLRQKSHRLRGTAKNKFAEDAGKERRKKPSEESESRRGKRDKKRKTKEAEGLPAGEKAKTKENREETKKKHFIF